MLAFWRTSTGEHETKPLQAKPNDLISSQRNNQAWIVGTNPGALGVVRAHAAGRKPVVAGHPWVYAATQPEYDIYPILDRIFADMSWAGIEAIELMSTALEPDGAVERIGELSQKCKLPVMGMSP